MTRVPDVASSSRLKHDVGEYDGPGLLRSDVDLHARYPSPTTALAAPPPHGRVADGRVTLLPTVSGVPRSSPSRHAGATRDTYSRRQSSS